MVHYIMKNGYMHRMKFYFIMVKKKLIDLVYISLLCPSRPNFISIFIILVTTVIVCKPLTTMSSYNKSLFNSTMSTTVERCLKYLFCGVPVIYDSIYCLFDLKY